MIPFSVLDLSPVPAGSTPSDALRNTLDLAQHAERWGFKRYWLAEHHNMPGIASAATAVVIGHVAQGTSTIRVGSGGVMLPNHAPLVVAEQFGTLAALFPDRIDLGLGRAPGTDPATARALRRNLEAGAENFPQDVLELLSYFSPAALEQPIRAVPGAGLQVPLYLLGSSLYSAQLAALLGLPFAFAAHFAPAAMQQALRQYRVRFEPSLQLAAPYSMLAVNVFAADTDEEARYHFTSVQQAFVNMRRGQTGPVPPPIDNIEAYWTPLERSQVQDVLSHSFVGSPATVEAALSQFLRAHEPEELLVAGHFYSHEARLRSFEIVASVRDSLANHAA